MIGWQPVLQTDEGTWGKGSVYEAGGE